MSDGDTTDDLVEGSDAPRTGVPTPTGKWIARTSRLGVWGLVAALIPPLSEALGGPIWLARMSTLSAGGLFLSGTGVIAASLLVLRSLRPGLSAVKVAALTGLPFGILLCLGGLTVLAPLSPFASVVDANGPLVLLLGVLVVVSLLVGFLAGGKNERSEAHHRVDRG